MGCTLSLTSQKILKLRVQTSPGSQVGQPSRSPSGEDKIGSGPHLRMAGEGKKSDGEEISAAITKLAY